MVWDDLVGVDLHYGPEALTTLTSTVCGVERERSRFERRDANTAIYASHFLGIELFFAIDYRDQNGSAGQPQGSFHAFSDTFDNAFFYQKPVDDDLNCVIFALVEDDLFIELPDFPIDPCPDKAFFMQLFELFFEFAFAAADNRSKYHHTLAFRKADNSRNDLFNRLTSDWSTALMAMRLADGREKQAKIIVNFGNRTDGRARAARNGFLLYRDCRA